MADDEIFDVEETSEWDDEFFDEEDMTEEAEWDAMLKKWREKKGDPVSLRKLGLIFERAGLYDKAVSIFEALVDCEKYWVTKNYGIVWYDENVNRWRDWSTGQFVRFEPSKREKKE
jgi:hypothetical protein